ncbi:MAG: D-alanyl-D-alanine carboxypeptidase (penicillin-binding protein 5/6) [Patiriisocius sp.]|jgi:D-alanyl-D-alanine carboxypeptidase (penicillin-binding protein 5/6)
MTTQYEDVTTETVAGDTEVHEFVMPEEEVIPREKIPVVQQLTLLAAILLLLLGGAITPKIIAYFADEVDSVPAAPILRENTDILETSSNTELIKPFSEVSIAADAAYVWDVRGQRPLYKKDESTQLPLASVTKLMTALIAYELLDDTEDVKVTQQALKQYGNSGLLKDETFDRITLSNLVLMSSSNDGAYALAAAAGEVLQKDNGANAFVHAMNIRAEELGLANTYFKNPTGLDIDETENGGNGSAKDMAFLMEYIVENQPEILFSTRESDARVYSEDGIYHDAVNTNYYIDEIPNVLGSKTGYTELAGGNLVIAFDAGLDRPIIISVLGSTRQERFTDVMELVEQAQAYVAQQ